MGKLITMHFTAYIITFLLHLNHAYQYLPDTSSPNQKYVDNNYVQANIATEKTEKYYQYVEQTSTEKIRNENNWRPILSSRVVNQNIEIRKPLHASQPTEYYTRFVKQQPPSTESKVLEIRTSTKLPIYKAKPLPNFKRIIPNENTKSINEDQIMWMYYGPPSEGNPPHRKGLFTRNYERTVKSQHTRENLLTSDENSNENAEYDLHTASRKSDDVAKLAEVTQVTTEKDWFPQYEDENDNENEWNSNSSTPSDVLSKSLNMDRMYYSVADFDDTKDITGEYAENHSSEKLEDNSHREIATENEPTSNKLRHGEKSGKFLGKPIVITEATSLETPNLTAEYYRKLFDSFGNHDDSSRENSNTKKNLEHHDTLRYNMTSSNEFSKQKESSPSANSVSQHVRKNETSKMENEKYADRERQTRKIGDTQENDVLKETHDSHDQVKGDEGTENGMLKMFTIYMKHIIPKTLKTNIFLVKQLLLDCYSDLHTKKEWDSNSINCLQKIIMKVLDKAINSDTIKITDTISLVKENRTRISDDDSSRSRSYDENTEWFPNLMEKLVKLFSTHSLKVQLLNAEDKSENFQVEGRRRHYRKVFPIMVGAYMILSTVLIPLGFKFMTLLGTKSLLLSKLSLMIALMGGIKKMLGFAGDASPAHSHYPPLYPTVYPAAFYPSYYDAWRRDELRKTSHSDDPTEFSHYSEEIE